MAPSTAALFLLFGVSVYFRAGARPSERERVAGLVCGAFGVTLALILLILSVMGVHVEAEHLGLRISGTLGDVAVGYISPLSAFCFVLGGISCGLLPSPASGRLPAMAGLLAAALLGMIAVVFTVAYLVGGPLMYGGSMIPPAMPTTLAFLALSSGLLLLHALRAGARDAHRGPPGEHVPTPALLVFVLLAAGILAAGALYSHWSQRRLQSEVRSRLIDIAGLKVADLVLWRQERLGDAGVFSGNTAFAGLTRSFLADAPDAGTRKAMMVWLTKLLDSNGYDRISLLDSRGVERAAVPGPVRRPVPYHPREVRAVLASGRPAILDFHRHPPDPGVHLAVLAPIIDESDGHPLGALVLRIDPNRYLYPWLKRWPTPSASAETLLVRRDGDAVLFLNDLRFRGGAAMALRIPLARADVPAVMAVAGREGIVEGLDYRGEPVVAALLAVPGSPWFLVARMDRSEALAGSRRTLWGVVFFIGVLLVAAAAAMYMIWQRGRLVVIRQRFEAAAALASSKARYQSLFEKSQDALMTLAPPLWAFTSGNAATVAMFGARDEADFTTRPPWGYSPERQPDGCPSGEKAIDMIQAAMTRGVHSFEWTHRRLSGEDFSASVLLTRLEAEGGPFLLATVRDETERKRAGNALRESEELYRTLVSALPDAVAMSNASGEIHFASPKAMEMLGFTDFGDVRARSIFDFIDPDSRRGLELSRKKMFREGSIRDFECTFLKRDGSRVPVEFSAAVARNVRGEPTGVIAVMRDVTQRKRLEEQLHQSQKMEAVGTLAGGVAHEFNNLLTVIKGYTELLLAEVTVAGATRQRLDRIQGAADRAALLTSHLLAFSRQQVSQARPVRLGEAVAGMETLLRAQAGEAVEFEVKLDPAAGEVMADPGQLWLVALNLVVNARDAMAGGGRLTIEVANAELDGQEVAMQQPVIPGPYVMLAVSDTGTGMDESTQARIFEPFFSTKGVGAGVGLGLSAVFGIVQHAGGGIAVESTPGRGSAFRVYLPRLGDGSDLPLSEGMQGISAS
ncbi:MAG: PAS domain S-box protein [Candidatus Coatesbacteria bacterium]